jgi:mono/diheme cytochrome c family protein
MKNWDFALLGIASLVLFGLTVWKDTNREWKKYQKKYYQMEYSQAMARGEKATLEPLKYQIKQIMVAGTDIVDRCPTCHLGFDNTEAGYKDNPYKAHPNPYQHPPERFGCTICHRGQGLATTVEDAHGYRENWQYPILKGDYVQASCSQCHQDQELVKTAPLFLKGKALFAEYECLSCHSLNGVGAEDAPDLTNEGNKKKRELDFGEYDRPEMTQADWQFMHLKDPQVFNPDSEMPNLDLSDEEAKALAIYILSLGKSKVPHTLIYAKRP